LNERDIDSKWNRLRSPSRSHEWNRGSTQSNFHIGKLDIHASKFDIGANERDGFPFDRNPCAR